MYVYICMYVYIWMCVCAASKVVSPLTRSAAASAGDVHVCVYACVCKYFHVSVYTDMHLCMCTYACMGWLRLVGSIK